MRSAVRCWREVLLSFFRSRQSPGSRARPGARRLAARAKAFKAARTPWGHPDLSGVYTNSDESGIPFEKPTEFTGRRIEDITEAELRS